MILLIILLVTIIWSIYSVLILPHRYWKNRGVKQGKPWFLFGDSWMTLFKQMDMAEAVTYMYNSIPNSRYYGIYQFLKPKLVIRDPDLIRRVTVKDFDHFMDHVAVTDPKADPLFSKNLLSLKGDEWRKMRSTLTGSFTSSKMKTMFTLISDAAEKFTQYYETSGPSEVDVKDAFTRFTIDVIASTSFGLEVNSLTEPNNEFFKMGKEITELSFRTFSKMMLYQISPRLFRFLKLTVFRKEVNQFFRDLIDTTIATRESQGIYRPDMLQILMDARKGADNQEDQNATTEVGFAVTPEFIGGRPKTQQKKITNEDITAQAVIFFFAGFDSVSSLMTFTSYELAINSEIQETLRQEIMDTLKSCGGKPTYEAIVNMKYMDMVVSEALRKWPPFVIVGRECVKSYTIEAQRPDERDQVIPKGMGIQIPSYAIHHDPKYYPYPDKFIPERFALENRDRLTPYTFLGFGQGPRSCLGSRFALLEIKTVLFFLLSRLKLVPIADKTAIPVKLSRKFSINIRPEGGLWLGLEPLKLK